MLDQLICLKQADFDSNAIAAFDSFLTKPCKSVTDVSYNLAYPKHMFLSYLTDCRQLLVHGSPTLD